jgi:glutathione synthase/RimK-type ligase-like ATP-grasp enzyme
MADSNEKTVLLATWSGMPDGEEWAGTDYLLPAMVERGLDARWHIWDDPDVDWSQGLVAVRSTWDYEQRRGEFLDWARSLPWVLNSAAVFEWNTDKAYLPQLAEAGVSVVPTVVVERTEDLLPAVAAFGPSVVKPCVGAGGRGVVVLDGTSDVEPEFGNGPWVVQPLVESVRTEGETSVFVLDGEVVSQAQKRPAPGELRVHERYGGTTVETPISDEAAELARRTVVAAEAILGERLDYARVDQMRLAGGILGVSELEVTEPGLYLEVIPGNAGAFADLVADRVRNG